MPHALHLGCPCDERDLSGRPRVIHHTPRQSSHHVRTQESLISEVAVSLGCAACHVPRGMVIDGCYFGIRTSPSPPREMYYIGHGSEDFRLTLPDRETRIPRTSVISIQMA
jgi:hypothetical protein